MDGESIDINQARLQRLKELFPELFAESQLDWEKLKAAFGDDINFANERYVLNWAGKSDAFKILQQPATATLKPVPEESVNFDATENLFIEGENLEVLKALQKAYYGKVKCIIIDPPYNTGSDSFIYPDRFSEKKEDYLKRIGDKDEEGFLLKEGLFRKNSKDSGHFHSNWLSMMYPRLFLAKNLLQDDGVIFVHIDDNEVHNLRMVMNEIFGEENFVCQFIREAIKGGSQSKFVRETHDYILVFAKRIDELEFTGFEKEEIELKLEDEKGPYAKGRELNKWGAGSRREDSPGMWFPIKGPNGEDVYPIRNDGSEGRWRLGKNKINKLVEDGEVIFEKRENGYFVVYEKLRGNKSKYRQFITILKDKYLNAKATEDLKDLFEKERAIFDFSKPSVLIKDLLLLSDTDNNDIIFDFFAGSGTTAQAVLELNKEDGSDRKFILVQMPEPCDESSEAYKAGYKTIADIAKERIRRVIKRLTPGPSPEREGSYAENLFKGATPILFKNANQLKQNITEAEELLWQALRNRQIENCKFRRQHPIGDFIADFYCHEKKLIVEIDGVITTEQKEYDAARTQAINEFSVRVMRFTNEEILNSLPEVLKKITEKLNAPSPQGEGRGEVGFKVFKLSPSSFKIWRGSEIDSEEKLVHQLDAFTNPTRPGAEKLNMLYELMLKAGYELASPVQYVIASGAKQSQGKKIASGSTNPRNDSIGYYSINNELIIALDAMNENLIEQIIAAKPQKVITLDSLFTGNDQLKTNTVLQMRDAGVDFKTI